MQCSVNIFHRSLCWSHSFRLPAGDVVFGKWQTPAETVSGLFLVHNCVVVWFISGS